MFLYGLRHELQLLLRLELQTGDGGKEQDTQYHLKNKNRGMYEQTGDGGKEQDAQDHLHGGSNVCVNRQAMVEKNLGIMDRMPQEASNQRK